MSGVNPKQGNSKLVYRNFPTPPSTFAALNMEPPSWKAAKDKRDEKVRLYNEQISEGAPQKREKYIEEYKLQKAQEDRDRNAQEDRDRDRDPQEDRDRDRDPQEDRDRDRDPQGPRKRLEEVLKNTGHPTQHPDAPVTMPPPPGLPAPVTMRGVALPGDVANLRTTERAKSFLSKRLHSRDKRW